MSTITKDAEQRIKEIEKQRANDKKKLKDLNEKMIEGTRVINAAELVVSIAYKAHEAADGKLNDVLDDYGNIEEDYWELQWELEEYDDQIEEVKAVATVVPGQWYMGNISYYLRRRFNYWPSKDKPVICYVDSINAKGQAKVYAFTALYTYKGCVTRARVALIKGVSPRTLYDMGEVTQLSMLLDSGKNILPYLEKYLAVAKRKEVKKHLKVQAYYNNNYPSVIHEITGSKYYKFKEYTGTAGFVITDAKKTKIIYDAKKAK